MNSEDKQEYTDVERGLAHFARAIGHPARVAVLLEIARRGYEVKGEIISVPSLSQATVLQHLRELKRAGLLQGRIFGAKADYRIDRENFNHFEQHLHFFFNHFKQS
jgi:ArsR family transcriptional regulator, arsenate/arsenite/antimonite-responsive transcriptional repressor